MNGALGLILLFNLLESPILYAVGLSMDSLIESLVYKIGPDQTQPDWPDPMDQHGPAQPEVRRSLGAGLPSNY